MPNRMLRDWTDSDKMTKISVHAERFFVRLIMKVDDYGCFYADTRLLKANLFPLLLDEIREADILRWMAECQKAELIVLYENSNKQYLQILEFNQRLRQKKKKYPMPTHDGQASDISQPEVEENIEVERKGSNTPDLSKSNLFRKPNIPAWEDVHLVFSQNGGTEEMARSFFDKNNSVGWFLKGSPITNFANLVPSFVKNWKEIKEKNGKSTSASARSNEAANNFVANSIKKFEAATAGTANT